MTNLPSPSAPPHRPAIHAPAPVEAAWNSAARFLAAHRGLSDSTLALLGVTDTALLGVIATDIFPPPGTSVAVPGALLASFTIGLVLLFLLIKLRAGRGTLYYFRIADEHWPDLHGATVEAARTRSLDYRSVTCAIDLGDQPVCDLIELVADARGRLEQATNDDDLSTSFEFAPNVPWPIALALGYDWPLPAETELVELGPDTESFRLKVPPIAGLQKDDLEPPPEGTRAAVVGVDIHLTGASPSEDKPIRGLAAELVGREADVVNLWGASAGQLLRLPDEGSVRDRVTITGDCSGIGPMDAAELAARAILQALHHHPQATVVVKARMPKVVAILTGLVLARSVQTRDAGSWRHPWRRLVLAHHDQVTGGYQSMLVRAGQPRV